MPSPVSPATNENIFLRGVKSFVFASFSIPIALMAIDFRVQYAPKANIAQPNISVMIIGTSHDGGSKYVPIPTTAIPPTRNIIAFVSFFMLFSSSSSGVFWRTHLGLL